MQPTASPRAPRPAGAARPARRGRRGRPRRLAAAAACLLGLGFLLALGGCAGPSPTAGTVELTLLAINDFHGYLEPPRGGLARPDPADPSKTVTIPAGGAAVMAGALAAARARDPDALFVAAGDLIGASPLTSALFKDEPTVEAMSRMGLVASAVGNHEFDHGAAELLRLQGLARFQYLAASTRDGASGRTLLPPYVIQRVKGVPVGLIGLTLKDTPHIVTAQGVRGLVFDDEVATVNALVPQLQAQGVQAIVVLIHEGGFPAAGPDACAGLSGPIVPIVQRLDPAVDLVISGHTHRDYVCRVGGRLLTSAGRYGTLLTEIRLQVDRASGDVVDANAANHVVDPARFQPDPAIAGLVADVVERARPLAERPVTRLPGPLSREPDRAGESPAGRLVADAQLAATRDAGAELALMNPGGLRADLRPEPGGGLRYANLYELQPFSNTLVTMTLRAADLQALLERQWQGQPMARVLLVSHGFGYRWDGRQPPGRRIVPGSLVLNGRALAPDDPVRLTVNSFLAGGGDNFDGFKAGTDRVTGPIDLDALEAWLRSGGAARTGSDTAPRIQRVD